jgi:hypothetical protein
MRSRVLVGALLLIGVLAVGTLTASDVGATPSRCKPTRRDVVDKFTVTCRRAALTGPDVLTEFQFAGDKEAHGVPSYQQ